jgi:hypothetical protein
MKYISVSGKVQLVVQLVEPFIDRTIDAFPIDMQQSSDSDNSDSSDSDTSSSESSDSDTSSSESSDSDDDETVASARTPSWYP